MSSSNTAESNEITSSGEVTFTPEKRKNDTLYALYSRRRIGILSVLFTPIVGAFMLADNYELLNDRKTANRLRICFLVGVPLCWFLFSMVSVYFSTAIAVAISALLAWFLPILVLDICYRRWCKEWIATNGEIVSGYGTEKAWLYVTIAIVVTFGFRVFISPIGSAIVISFLSSAPPTTFVDGAFSITYPSSWTAREFADFPNCDVPDVECVQQFILPSSHGSFVVARTTNISQMGTDLEELEQFFWNSAISNSSSNRIFVTTLDGYKAIQRNFTVNDPSGEGLEGMMLITKTKRDLYFIISVNVSEAFYLIEQAIATIQLDLISK